MGELTFPDPKKNSKDQKVVVVEFPEIINIYNQEVKPKQKATRMTSDMQKWYLKECRSRGWLTARFFGNQCLLSPTAAPKPKKKDKGDK